MNKLEDLVKEYKKAKKKQQKYAELMVFDPHHNINYLSWKEEKKQILKNVFKTIKNEKK
jgi:hypothetical protein